MDNDEGSGGHCLLTGSIARNETKIFTLKEELHCNYDGKFLWEMLPPKMFPVSFLALGTSFHAPPILMDTPFGRDFYKMCQKVWD